MLFPKFFPSFVENLMRSRLSFAFAFANHLSFASSTFAFTFWASAVASSLWNVKKTKQKKTFCNFLLYTKNTNTSAVNLHTRIHMYTPNYIHAHIRSKLMYTCVVVVVVVKLSSPRWICVCVLASYTNLAWISNLFSQFIFGFFYFFFF